MDIKERFAQYGFTVESPHICLHTGNAMRAFHAPNDPYEETGCFLDTVTGEVEIDIGTNSCYFGKPDGPKFISALEAAQKDIAEQSVDI